MLASPLHWDKGDWLKAGLVAGITGGLYLLDDKIRDFAQDHRHSVGNKLATAGNYFGTPLYTAPPVAAFYLYGYLADDKKARKTALLAVESLAIGGLFTQAIKVTAHRVRPSSGAPPDQWGKESTFIPPIAYGLATLTGFARIYGNQHWASDVFAGAALGYFVGKAVVRFHKDDTAKKVSITPMVSGDYKGLTLSFDF